MSVNWRPILLLLAAIIGAIFALGERIIFASALGRPTDFSEPDVLWMQAALVALPFFFLAFRLPPRIEPWTVLLIATAWLHWWWLSKGIAYQKAPDGSGVDMGGALIMLLSPIPLTFLSLSLDATLRRQERS